MTNDVQLHHPDSVTESQLRALAPVGGRRRPVRIVQHPAFRRPATAVAGAGSWIAMPVRIVTLDLPRAQGGRAVEAA